MEFQFNEQLINIFILRQAQYDKEHNIDYSPPPTHFSFIESSQRGLWGNLGIEAHSPWNKIEEPWIPDT